MHDMAYAYQSHFNWSVCFIKSFGLGVCVWPRRVCCISALRAILNMLDLYSRPVEIVLHKSYIRSRVKYIHG